MILEATPLPRFACIDAYLLNFSLPLDSLGSKATNSNEDFSMNTREATVVLETIFKPWCLNDVQDLVFRQSWEGQTYPVIAENFDYDCDYIKEVGSQLWKLLSKKLGEKVTKSNIHSTMRRVAQQNRVEGVFESDVVHCNKLITESSTASRRKAVNYLEQSYILTGKEHSMSQSFNYLENTQCTKCSPEERLNVLFQLTAKIESLLATVENAVNDVQKVNEVERQVIKELWNWSGRCCRNNLTPFIDW